METFGVTEAEARAQMAHAGRKQHEQFHERCARAEAAAHKRKDPADRPREGWHVVDFSGPKQIWFRGDDRSGKGRQETVVGQPMRGLWRYLVNDGGKCIADGAAGFLGIAMEAAENAGTLEDLEPVGNG